MAERLARQLLASPFFARSLDDRIRATVRDEVPFGLLGQSNQRAFPLSGADIQNGAINASKLGAGAVTGPKFGTPCAPLVLYAGDGTSTAPSTGWFAGSKPNGFSLTEAQAQIAMPYACRLSALRTRSTQGATGTSRFTVNKNGVATALDTGAVAGTGALQNINDLVNTVDFALGDLLSVQATWTTVNATFYSCQLAVQPL